MSPETSVRTWMPGYPCRHDKAVFSPSVGERKLMKYSFVCSVR
jgi:hypothetical protein